MSVPMNTQEALDCWEELSRVPNLPAYAERALLRLAAEFWRARNSESLKQEALDSVRAALADADSEVEGAPPNREADWR